MKMKMRSVSRLVRRGARSYKKAEKAGTTETLRKRLALAAQLVEIAMLATAVAKGLRIGKAAKAKKSATKRVARRAKARA
jgi:hypothetical protein